MQTSREFCFDPVSDFFKEEGGSREYAGGYAVHLQPEAQAVAVLLLASAVLGRCLSVATGSSTRLLVLHFRIFLNFGILDGQATERLDVCCAINSLLSEQVLFNLCAFQTGWGSKKKEEN